MREMKRGISTLGLVTVIVLAAGLCVGLSTASAVSVYTHPFIASVDGSASETPAGPAETFQLAENVGFDQATHSLYVLDRRDWFLPDGYGVVLHRFDASGNPRPFTAVGPTVSAMPVACPYPANSYDVAVDNSGGTTQSRFFV